MDMYIHFFLSEKTSVSIDIRDYRCFFFSTLFFPHDIIDSSKHVVPNCDGKKHLRFKDVSIECRVALAIAQVLGLNPTKKHKKPLENLKRCFTNITQPPHVALYQIQLPGQKSDKTRSFHSHRFFRKSLRGDSVQEKSVKPPKSMRK